jgi:hypothetical protein
MKAAVGRSPPLVWFIPTHHAIRRIRMYARKVAAQFAAYVWFEEIQKARPSKEARARFARESWRPFVPVAPAGLGRLLLKIAVGRPGRRRLRIPGRAKLR